MGDIPTFWILRSRGELTAGDWIRSWLGAEVHAYGALDDLRPVLSHYEYGKSIANMLASILKGDLKV